MNPNPSRHRHPTPDEQLVLDQLLVRPVRPDELARYDQLIAEHHYLKNAHVVGEHLRYVATYHGEWLALATWSAPALHLKPRDAFLGWSEEQRRRRLALIANNSRLLVLPECQHPNLISRFMKRMLARLSDDWHRAWGHPLALAETFVDPQRYQGTAYKVSGWCRLGQTAGWKRSAEDFYQKHDCPKQLWVRELVPHAARRLRSPQLPPAWATVEAKVPPRCTAKAAPIRSLVEQLRAEVAEVRAAKALAYPIAGLLALIALAMFSGVRRGPQDLADYAATLSQGQLRALGFRCHPGTTRVRCPGVTPFREVLKRVDARQVERALLLWQEQLLGPNPDPLVIVDGKELRHAHVELVSAVNGAGRWLGTGVVAAGSNEIPAVRAQLARLELNGKKVLADALHTQVETAHDILWEGGGDYLFTVKDNQKQLVQTLATLLTEQRFSPSPDPTDPRTDAGTQPRPPGDSGVGLPRSHSRTSRLPWRATHCPVEAAGAAPRQKDHGDRLSDQQPDPRTTGRGRLDQTETRLLGD